MPASPFAVVSVANLGGQSAGTLPRKRNRPMLLTSLGNQLKGETMPLQGEYEPSSLKWVRDQVAEYESSGGTKGTKLSDVPVVVITSLGASSGKLRKNPVMRVEHGGVYAAVASKGGAPQHPAWYRNFVEHPLVELQDEGAKGDSGRFDTAPGGTVGWLWVKDCSLPLRVSRLVRGYRLTVSALRGERGRAGRPSLLRRRL